MMLHSFFEDQHASVSVLGMLAILINIAIVRMKYHVPLVPEDSCGCLQGVVCHSKISGLRCRSGKTRWEGLMVSIATVDR